MAVFIASLHAPDFDYAASMPNGYAGQTHLLETQAQW